MPPCRAALFAVALSASSCSRGREEATRAAAAFPSPSLSAFVWPLAATADAGDHAPPRKAMVWVPRGTLVAGTPKERTPRIADEELPGEPIDLSGFYIDEFAYPDEAGGIPKTGMTRDEAAGVCAAQDKRLCTELEWERACKGPGNATYEYGETYRAAECAMGQPGRLAPSGLRVACKSAFGVHDMHGGPWEWTASVWRRGGGSQAGTVRGGNSDSGELVGRCANAMAVTPSSRRSDVGARCCAGEANAAEVRLAVARGKTLEARVVETTRAGNLAEAVRDKALSDLPGDQPFRIDRIWHWHPVGNEELVVAAGCSKRAPHLACGVGVFRERSEGSDAGVATPVLVGFASSGWWKAVVKTDSRDRDLWVYGGDGTASFRRRVAYVWGRIALGDAERASPHGLAD
jgi:sulfatase-modifying factor enzyme 1